MLNVVGVFIRLFGPYNGYTQFGNVGVDGYSLHGHFFKQLQYE